MYTCICTLLLCEQKKSGTMCLDNSTFIILFFAEASEKNHRGWRFQLAKTKWPHCSSFFVGDVQNTTRSIL